MLINELIGNYFAKVYRTNTGMPIWDSSIWYNDTHPRFNFHLELFLYLKFLSHDIESSDKNTCVLCEESRYRNYYLRFCCRLRQFLADFDIHFTPYHSKIETCFRLVTSLLIRYKLSSSIE